LAGLWDSNSRSEFESTIELNLSRLLKTKLFFEQHMINFVSNEKHVQFIDVMVRER